MALAEDKTMGLKGWLTGPRSKEVKTEAGQAAVHLDKQRLAVLPLANVSPDAHDEYFADGLTEELITTLSRLRGLQVIARTSVMPYKTAGKRVSEIGRELEVGSVLEGSVRKVANKVRVTTQLIETTSQTHIWSNTYDRELDDIFAVQTDIATQVADALRVRILPEERQRIEKAPTKSSEAFSLYLKGRFWWNKRTEEGVKKSITYFEEAATVDPNYPLAYVGIADAYSALYGRSSLRKEEVLPIREQNLAKALELDEQLSEAHASLGLIHMDKWEWSNSEAEFKRAIELNPSYATAHHWYSILFRIVGRMDEAMTEIKKARKLDPLSLIILSNEGEIYLLTRNYDRAIALHREALEMDPDFEEAVEDLAIDYIESSRVDALLTLWPKLEGMFGESRPSFARTAPLWAAANVTIGKPAEARRLVEVAISARDKANVSPVEIAIAQLKLGEKDEAFRWLEVALKEKAQLNLKAPVFDPIRSDPRFSSLLRKMKLEL